VRLISATNAALEDEVGAGRFRQDLLFRLNTVEIRLPPLRERREDIPLLAAHFLRVNTKRYRKPIAAFDAAALKALLDHAWPGNVRELEHVVERAVLMSRAATIGRSDLGLQAPSSDQRLEDMSIEDVEALLIRKALVRHEGNVSKTAETLGLSRSALYRRIQRYGL
jgi:DNA-binding NtrC family response regulator